MKLHKLINQVEWPEVWEAILRHYPDQDKFLEGYRLLFAQMLTMEPLDQPGCLDITPYCFDSDDDKPDGAESPADVHYYEHDEPDIRYGVGFIKRAELLGMDIKDQTVYSGPELVAHILWETTWHGFNEKDVQAQLEDITDRVKEVENYTDEERAAKLIPWDKVKSELGITDED